MSCHEIRSWTWARSGAALLCLLLLSLVLPSCGGGGGGGGAATVSGRVRLDTGAPATRVHATAAFTYGRALACMVPGEEAQAARELADLDCRVVEENPGAACVIAFDLPAGIPDAERRRLTLERIAALDRASCWAYAEPSYRRTIRRTPNDPRYDEQWHYPLINLPAAWDITTGSDDVIVAVIDTGGTNHPDMAGRQTAGYDFISDRSVAGDGDGRDSDPTDVGDSEFPGEPSSFHGTHVAGTVGAASDNGDGVAGVTWKGQVMHLRVLGRGGGDDADIIAAVRYAARLPNASGQLPAKRADVINMSLGGGGFSQSFQDACTAARNAGVIIVAAAGNSGDSSIEYPAAFDGVISVAAVGRDGNQASYSTRNRAVDIAAPGGDTFSTLADGVLSTIQDDSGGSPVAGYTFYDGTSMAAPHLAGVAALVRAVDPDLTPAQVENILFTTATDKGAAGRDNRYGHGLVDAFAAVRLARDGVSGPSLQVASSALSFQVDGPAQDVAITNGGTGLLTVTAANASTGSGGSWLSATTFGSGDASRSVDGVRVQVDAAGLAQGTYVGQVQVTSNGGDRTIGVTLQVGQSVVHVELRDWFTDAFVARVPVAGDGTFHFPAVAPGDYVLVAGTDENGDGAICDPGGWCGRFGDATPITVAGSVGDIEIVLRRTSANP